MGSDDKKENRRSTYAVLISEIAFVILPLIVITITILYQENYLNIITTPEWSVGTAILMGQTIIKLTSAAAVSESPNWRIIACVIALLIVLGLVPAMIILSLLLVANCPSVGLGIAQITLFIIGIAVFMIIGAAGQSSLVKISKV